MPEPATHADLSTKDFDCEIKSLDDAGRFRIYFSVFGNVDRAKEIVEPGAYRNLDEFARSGWVGLNHQMERLPVAYPISVIQDGKGLLVEGQFHSHPDAQDCRAVVLERMKAGKSVLGSVGYKVISDSPDYVGGERIRRLNTIDLYECSFVNLPANPKAELMSAKSLEGQNVDDKVVTIEALKSWLDVQTKAGRVLSKSNHGKLKAWHGTLTSMCTDMKGLVDQYDPDKLTDDEPDGDEATQPAAKEVDPNRSAGNSIPGDQGIGGAATAQNRKHQSEADLARARIQKNLDDMRARAVRVHTNFALMR